MEIYENLLYGFIEKLNTLEKVLPNTLLKLTDDAIEAMNNLDAFIREKCIISNETDEGFEYEVPVTEVRLYKQKKSEAEDLFLSSSIVGKSYIVTLVSQYDQFFFALLKTMFSDKPELLRELGKTLSVSELTKYTTIDEVLKDVVTKETDTVMRDGHLAQIEYLEKKIKGDIKADKELLRKFVELTERRNLFVHTDGVISKQYLEACNREGYALKEEHQLGFELDADPKYFYGAVATLNEFAVKTVIFLLKKLHPDQPESAKDLGIHAIYKNLEFKNFQVVRNLVKYVSKVCELNRSEQMIVAVNNVLSYYMSNKKEEAKKQLEVIDWSDASDRFRLAKYVILEDFTTAAKLMRRIGNEADSEISELDYHQWPLFSEFRKSAEFREAYRDTFGREFDSVEQSSVAGTTDHEVVLPEDSAG